LHDRDVPGELGEEPYRAGDDLIEVHRTGEEGLDRPALRGGERLDLREPVDEQAIALVGRHSTRARMGLRYVSHLLECRHVVPDRRRLDSEVVSLPEPLGADRLLGGPVVLDYGAKHGQPEVVEQGLTSSTLG